VDEIFVMNRDGSGVTQLTSGSVNEQTNYPYFSPDGTKIIFSSDRAGVGLDHIYVMDANGANLTRMGEDIENDTGDHSRFSPNGNKILFSGDNVNGNADIYLMNYDGSNRTRLTNVSGLNFNASFSSDGTKILFTSDRAEGNFDLYLMNVHGTGLVRLTNHPAEDSMGVMAP